MDELLKLPILTTADKASQLRYLYDKICVSVRGLADLDITSDKYGCFLIPVIMTKLPTDVRVQVAHVTSKDVWEFTELITAIKTEVQPREISEAVRTNEVNIPNQPKKPIPSASTLVVRDNLPPRHFNIQCLL
ncbi:hypothetical protein SNE40_009610 [Patella caerulea]|uniref:Uncharacterized protein n=1 Tax=Patella caerulea TaxID=87958 RepID=A0AAN8PS04_PATCE